MTSISAQAGTSGQVIDLGAAVFRAEPRRPAGGPAPARVACCPDCVRFDTWVREMGGITGDRYAVLRAEAREMAGPAGESRYLDLAREADESRVPGEALAELSAAVELAGARSAREASRRADAAATAVLRRTEALELAARSLAADPRLACDPDLGPGPGMGSAEVALELRAAMGLVGLPPTRYEASLPPVADLARTIGLR